MWSTITLYRPFSRQTAGIDALERWLCSVDPSEGAHRQVIDTRITLLQVGAIASFLVQDPKISTEGKNALRPERVRCSKWQLVQWLRT